MELSQEQLNVAYAYLVEGKSHAEIEKDILKLRVKDSHNGWTAGDILRNLGLDGKKKHILKKKNIDDELINASGVYLQTLKALKNMTFQQSASDKYSWIPFYKELAKTLLTYKEKRQELLSFIYTELPSPYVSYLHESDGKTLSDICPFTVLGIFNRGIKYESRTDIAEIFKRFFNLRSDVPTEFNGIPVLNNQKSHFFGFREHRDLKDIDNLWFLFEQALDTPYKIEEIYNKVITQFCVNVNITMGLYWVDPDHFIALDKLNRAYLAYYEIRTNSKVLPFKNYLQLIQDVEDKMKSNVIYEKSFPEFSYAAFRQDYYSETEGEYMDSGIINTINSLLEFKKNIILQGAPGTGKTRAAKDSAEQMIFGSISFDKKQQAQHLNSSKQYKLVQFHPSYSYEDFVRGVKVEFEDGQPNYKTENKHLIKFAEEAFKNWEDSKKEGDMISKEEWLDSHFEDFISTVVDAIDLAGEYKITDNISIVSIDEGAFRYKGKEGRTEGWNIRGNRMLFKDIKQAYIDNNKERHDIKHNESLSGLARWHSSYYIRVLNNFRSYLEDSNITYISSNISRVKLQNYVLIIDEINRANLPTVLGELIYALEYRGEKVDSIYEIDKESSLILPPNLYIIGTMNTADRSVGQIDYAIRRRFAFFDMLPMELNGKGFDTDLFAKVSELFIANYEKYMDEQTDILKKSEYLSPEFRPEDVWLGHSYFIMKTDPEGVINLNNRKMRLHYEIIPLLREYLKDGVFNTNAETFINELQ